MGRDKVFICYSRKDAKYRDEVVNHFAGLGQGQPLVYTDQDNELGEDWRARIDEALASTRVAVLLVSPDFLTSAFIREVELPELLRAATADGALVVPVFVRPSTVTASTFSFKHARTGEERELKLTVFQGLNGPKKTLSEMPVPRRERLLADLAMKVQERLSALPARPTASSVDVRPYLERLRDDNRWVEIRGMGARGAHRMELREVYTRLRVSAAASAVAKRTQAKRADEDDLARGSRDLELSETLREHADVALVGDPGSGKTTFLRFVAMNLARAGLGGRADKALNLIGLSDPAPFPLFLRLSAFGEWLRTQEAGADGHAPEHFYRYLDAWQAAFPDCSLPVGFLRGRVREGGCMLLLDGIDEVAGDETRLRVSRIIEQVALAGRRVRNRHLVTSRTRAWEGRVQLAADFTTCTLAPFGDDEIERFVTQWSAALHGVGAPDASPGAAADAARYADELRQAIRGHAGILPLTSNPLMLTVLAVVHWNERKLPEGRAELYQKAIEWLLASRDPVPGDPPNQQRKECLQALAWRMVSDPLGVQKSLGRDEAAEVVAPVLGRNARETASYLDREELTSGIVVRRSVGHVEFWHLTFEEYLAAVEVAQRDEWWDLIRTHLFEDRWSEVVLLLAGELRRNAPRKVKQLIERVLALDRSPVAQARAVGLIGRILRDLRPYGGDPAQGTGYGEALGRTLALFERGGVTAPENVRVEVGEALGQAGDPRLAEEVENRVLIRGGSFFMGGQEAHAAYPGFDPEADDDEAPVRQVAVSAFLIGRYPVTVAEFEQFVEAGPKGYLDRAQWSRAGWTWRVTRAREWPSWWEQQLRHRNRPVTHVAWYEAEAWCRWKQGFLLTEAQWEFAARGSEGRKYPWGDKRPTDQHANFAGRVLGPTPIGIYPKGATPEGVHDLAGNVWEWCADWQGPYPPHDEEDPRGPGKGFERVLRGGSFGNGTRGLRAACRYVSGPVIEDDNVGFRCGWAPPAERGVAASEGGQP